MAQQDSFIEESKQTFYNHGLYLTIGKTDEELRNMVYDHVDFLRTVNEASPASIRAEALRRSAELNAFNDILSRRKEDCEKWQAAQKKWVDEEENRTDQAFLKLRHAASANGQLVAAVLEDEDGLTAGDIGAFCGELAQLPEDELTSLLNGLENENVISKDDTGRYHLNMICTPDLYPDYQSLINKLKADGKWTPYRGGLLDYLYDGGESGLNRVCPCDPDYDFKYIEASIKVLCEGLRIPVPADLDLSREEQYRQLNALVDEGYLEKINLAGDTGYFPAMLRPKITTRFKPNITEGMLPTQRKNEEIKARILNIIAEQGDGAQLSAREVQEQLGDDELTGSKVTALLTQLKNDGILVRTEIDRKAYFSLKGEK